MHSLAFAQLYYISPPKPLHVWIPDDDDDDYPHRDQIV